jgi:hypothetical protein
MESCVQLGMYQPSSKPVLVGPHRSRRSWVLRIKIVAVLLLKRGSSDDNNVGSLSRDSFRDYYSSPYVVAEYITLQLFHCGVATILNLWFPSFLRFLHFAHAFNHEGNFNSSFTQLTPPSTIPSPKWALRRSVTFVKCHSTSQQRNNPNYIIAGILIFHSLGLSRMGKQLRLNA